ncbi:MAG TPA: MFS transporter [Anaerolineae bacterium]|nr:MFS transporter [Anaerolineae bacterium]HIQ05925.1 MFS transporter [Anaerolineae bacterium]
MEEKLHRRIINAWAMYDWANSAFATTIMAAVLPPFFSKVAGSTLPGNLATVYWGYTATVAMLIIAVSAPILGAIADYTGSKKRFLAGFAIMGILFTIMLYFVSQGDWLKAIVFFILGNVGFAGSGIFYDSLLPHIARPDEIDQVSARGYALGYLGGGLLLALNLAWIMFPHTFGFPNAEIATRASFVSVGVWWAVFSIPLFRLVPEPPMNTHQAPGLNPVVAGFRRLLHTMREVRRYRQLALFIVAFWLYNDGIGTIIKMATIYGSEIGIGQTDLIGALLMIQFVGVPFAFFFGYLARRLGTKPSILLGLAVYALISIGGYFMTVAWHFWLLAFLVGMVQGGTQALSRSLYGAMVPKSRSAEFFGFYNVSSKFAGIVGPFVFALVGQLTGSSRLSIVTLIFFFIAGSLLLTLVDEKEGIRIAQAEA